MSAAAAAVAFENCETCSPAQPCYKNFDHVCRKSPVLVKRLENDRAELRQALIRVTGSIGLMIKGANPTAPGHLDNYNIAKSVIAKTEVTP